MVNTDSMECYVVAKRSMQDWKHLQQAHHRSTYTAQCQLLKETNPNLTYGLHISLKMYRRTGQDTRPGEGEMGKCEGGLTFYTPLLYIFFSF